MKISYNWLKQFIKTDWNSEETSALLTDLGLEVEGVEKYQSVKGGLEGIVVGHVLTCVQHPDADRLKITTVDLGNRNSRTNCLWCSQCSRWTKSTGCNYWNYFIRCQWRSIYHQKRKNQRSRKPRYDLCRRRIRLRR